MNAADVSRCQFSPRAPDEVRERDRQHAVLAGAAEEHVGDEQVVPDPEELEDRERRERRHRQRDDEPPEDREVVGAVDLGRLDDRGRQRADVVAQQVDRQREPEPRVGQPHAEERARPGRGRGRWQPPIWRRRCTDEGSGSAPSAAARPAAPTTSTNRTSRPRKCIHEKAYAANAAIVIGITVAGIADREAVQERVPEAPGVERVPVVLERPLRGAERMREDGPPSGRVDERLGAERRDQHAERSGSARAMTTTSDRDADEPAARTAVVRTLAPRRCSARRRSGAAR